MEARLLSIEDVPMWFDEYVMTLINWFPSECMATGKGISEYFRDCKLKIVLVMRLLALVVWCFFSRSVRWLL